MKTAIEQIIVVVFIIIFATTIPQTEKPSIYVNPEQELAFQLEHERVEEDLRKTLASDAERMYELNNLKTVIEIAYSAYALLPIHGSDMANYISEKVDEYNKLTDGEGCIYFDDEIPELSITTIIEQVIGFGRYPQEGE